MARFWALGIVGILAVAGLSSAPGALASSEALSPAPALPPTATSAETIASQLRRYRGQTRFLSAERVYRFRAEAAMAGAPTPAPGGAGGKRDIQESDVFKVGKPGSKLLFLLNDYRGLQTVSYAQGQNSPQLLGHVAPSGNWPVDMYYDATQDRLLVLERLWYDVNASADSNSTYYRTQQSRIVVYDVKDPAHPTVAQEVPVEGEIADSRLVGDVLYLATSVRPDWSNHYGADQTAYGMALSFKVKAGSPIVPIDQKRLALPTSARENMNIVEVQENGTYKYYLLAVLSQSGWGWWDRKSLVEAVDVSDPQGKINPLMVVSAKGFINERSQTSIKNGTLVVVSNYTIAAPAGTPAINGWTPSSLGRIAVETFRLPTAQSEILSEDEASFRRAAIERTLKLPKFTTTPPANSSQDETMDLTPEQDALYKQLIVDPQTGIQGRFVQTADGKLRKPLPDSVVTTGDTTGLSANLQDVRYDGDQLYVFWVPANQIDPFDVFDLSHPENGVKFVRRLQFDGWVERAIPMTYQGRKFVLGLGWVVPAVDNEHNHRYPQAVLFEVTGSGATSRVQDVADLTIGTDKPGQQAWTDFNSGDKFVEVHPSDDGSSGSIMFGMHAYDSKAGFVSGGKLVYFDLNAAVSGQSDSVFKEGSLLRGDSGWLKRVFSNSEIDRVNTFSNEALGTFDSSNSAARVANAVNILELARDIRGYLPLGASRGVQIISNPWWMGNPTNPSAQTTRIRLVDSSRPDSELADVMGETTVPGTYVDALSGDVSASAAGGASAPGTFVVLTRNTATKTDPSGRATTDTEFVVSRFSLDFSSGRGGPTRLNAQGQASWSPTPQTSGGLSFGGAARSMGASMPFRPGYFYPQLQWFRLASGELYLQSGKELQRVSDVASSGTTGTAGLKLDGVSLAQCDPATDAVNDPLFPQIVGAVTQPTLVNLNGAPYLWYQVQYSSEKGASPSSVSPDLDSVQYTRPMLAPLTPSSDGLSLSCGPAMNVPGRPLSVTQNTLLTLDDGKLVDWESSRYVENATDPAKRKVTTTRTPVNGRAIESLRLMTAATGPILVPQAELQDDLDLDPQNYVTPEKLAPGFLGYLHSPQQNYGRSAPELVWLATDADSRLLTQTSLLGQGVLTGASILGVFQDTSPTVAPNSYLALLGDGRRVQALRWTLGSFEASVVPISTVPGKVAAVDPNDPSREKTWAILPGYFYQSPASLDKTQTATTAQFDPDTRSFLLPQGDYGVTQLFLNE